MQTAVLAQSTASLQAPQSVTLVLAVRRIGAQDDSLQATKRALETRPR